MSLCDGALKLAFAAYKRVLSPVLHAVGVSQCIFLPTCSEYAYVAMSRYGVWRGGAMAVRRVMRCHPLAKGGFDPVP
jgi:putative membrane protein insertion efficiency factor